MFFYLDEFNVMLFLSYWHKKRFPSNCGMKKTKKRLTFCLDSATFINFTSPKFCSSVYHAQNSCYYKSIILNFSEKDHMLLRVCLPYTLFIQNMKNCLESFQKSFQRILIALSLVLLLMQYYTNLSNIIDTQHSVLARR